MIEYSIDKNYLNTIKHHRDVLALLMKHSFESFVFSVRTGEFNYAIARELGFSESDAEKYFLSGMYHDVGKIGMSKFLIDYPARYNEDMKEQMRKHTDGGGFLLELTNAENFLVETAKFHHCNYDGTGYMETIQKDAIPFHARLTRVSDSADAYLSTRTYKPGYSVSGLYDDLAQFSGTWYDPEIIKALEQVHNRIINSSTSGEGEMSQDEYMHYMKKLYSVDSTAEQHLFDVIRNA
ncbi:HD domain-containing protein [Priestia filamentosa]|uniref:HD-GYP domain-containing protein n=1 Tax=Priestia filamentosa TaxID=1402861 RepID=UPI00397E25C6